MNKITFLKKQLSDVLTYQAKMINFIICFHTQWEVFSQFKAGFQHADFSASV